MNRIDRIIKLDTFIRGTAQCRDDGHLLFEMYERDRDGACLDLDPVTGAVACVSWLESGHNGSEYDRRTRTLGADEAASALVNLERGLFSQARMKVQYRELQEQHDRERRELDERTEQAVFES